MNTVSWMVWGTAFTERFYGRAAGIYGGIFELRWRRLNQAGAVGVGGDFVIDFEGQG
jgi:hypothetical protein